MGKLLLTGGLLLVVVGSMYLWPREQPNKRETGQGVPESSLLEATQGGSSQEAALPTGEKKQLEDRSVVDQNQNSSPEQKTSQHERVEKANPAKAAASVKQSSKKGLSARKNKRRNQKRAKKKNSNSGDSWINGGAGEGFRDTNDPAYDEWLSDQNQDDGGGRRRADEDEESYRARISVEKSFDKNFSD